MNTEPNYALSFDYYTKEATTVPKREIIVNIKRENTNQTCISFMIGFLTTALRYLTDTTTNVMQHLLIYHDITLNAARSIIESTNDHVYNVVSNLTDHQGTDLHVIVSTCIKVQTFTSCNICSHIMTSHSTRREVS
ncbi:unnamed protein product [Eruca vesicaria subsp. sativa]|uniref:Uncharacterized protein n=1 Tax=Eruca vesicaria subsp. sativa TaxID=29727 RepID=A0ABC8IXG9_ERUVS|nr:unnamed protein product [Eruca vesicaria subsp. sativa]